MALSTRVDNVLLLMYSSGQGTSLNAPVDGVARLHHLVYLLQQEGRLWLPRTRPNRYLYLQTDAGLVSMDFLDDLFALYALGLLQLEPMLEVRPDEPVDLRRYFRDLSHGERLLRDFEPVLKSRLSLSTPTGTRLGMLLWDAISPEDRDYLVQFRTRFEKADLVPLVAGNAPVATASESGAERPGARPAG